MTNSSATGGPLLPLTSPILGQALSRFLQQWLVGVTGLDPTMVRPRWQAEPPNIPVAGTAWAAVGISRRVAEGTPWQGFLEGTETYTLSRQEIVTLLVSFYDTGIDQSADALAETLREGIQIGQNREVIAAAGFGVVSVGDLQPVPTLLKERWLYRVDLPIRLRRNLVWTYNVLSVQSAEFTVEFEQEDGTLYTQTVTVTP